MRLLYLYCRSINDSFKEPLDGLDLNFDSEWRFEYSEGVLRVKRGTPLPKEFFSKDDGRVDVSVVVGCNGAGKTSIARIIHRLSIGDSNLGALIVCEDGGTFSLITARMTVEIEPYSRGSGAVESSVINSLKNHTHTIDGHILREVVFKFVYYSPIYTSQHQMDLLPKVEREDIPRFFYDISTSGLMRNPDRFHVGRDQPNDEPWKQFEREEARCIWEFLCEYRAQKRKSRQESSESGNGRLSAYELIPRLAAVTVSINEAALSFIECEYRERLKEYRNSYTGVQTHKPLAHLRENADDVVGKKEKFCQSVVDLFDRKSKFKIFSSKALFAYAVCRWYDLNLGIGAEPSDPDMNLFRLLDMIAANGYADRDLKRLVPSFIGDVRGRGSAMPGQDSLVQFIVLLAECSTVGKEDASPDHIVVRASKPDERVPILPIAEMHLKLKTLTDFLVLEPNPRISSGEWSLLSMFARIFALKSRLLNHPTVLFLDEVETTLHPDMQRYLVSGMIDFCERFLPDNRVHLIFLTHSQQLLSDVPKGNAVLLKRNENGERGIAEMSGNTFGANVYDLLKDGFFMENGAVGEFATKKIGDLLRSLVDGGMINDELRTESRLLANMVGDRVLRGYFNRLESMGKL